MSAGDTGSSSQEVEKGAADSGGANGRARKDAAAKHASVTELELQFAQNPESDAYIDLCEAYLDQGRFMEAMVVCKKGIKAHPGAVHARVLLARVYAVQKKYKRSLTELDKLAKEHPDDASVYVARGRTRIDSGNETDGIADLKRALDLDASLTEATTILAAKDIVYPEAAPPEPAPAPPPPAAPPPTPHPTADLPPPASGVSATPVSTVPMSSPAADLHVQAPTTSPTSSPDTADLAVAPARRAMPRNVSHFGMGPPTTNSGAAYQVMPQQLEGEDELEKIAQKVADEKPDRGRPKTTLVLLVALSFLAIGLVTWRFISKSRIEGIDRLTTQAVPAFNRDTYGSYKQAAQDFENILEDYDGNHALTAARLAHTYAILMGEHGESDLKPKLDAALAHAAKVAPAVSHTIAARTLAVLYEGNDRQDSAARAVAIAEPFVRDIEAGGAAPTHANVALSIAELELGGYEDATKKLGRVKQVLPGSVRAKVWHARAAFRARRMGTAISGFSSALRAEPNHPGALAGRALARLERGDFRGAAKDLLAFDKLAREQPKNISLRDQAQAEFARSEILRSAGEGAKATGAYEQAVRLDPQNADFPFGLGKWLVKNNRAKEAIAPLSKAVEMEPSRWAFLVELAEAKMRNGQYQDAKKHIDEALAAAPTALEALIAKARWMRRRKQPQTEAYLKGLLEKHPSATVDVHLELGRHYRKLGRLPDARKELELAIEKMPRHPLSKQSDVLLSYGLLMDDLKEAATAANSYEKAAQMGDVEGWFRLANNLVSNGGDRKKALKACSQYLAAGASLRFSNDARALCDRLR